MDMLDIARIAEECGFRGAPLTLTWTQLNRFGEAVARFAVEEEREACAKACEKVGNQPSTLWEEADCWSHAAEICAHDIRARK